MKTVIFAEKPSQAKAYAEAFTVKSRHESHIGSWHKYASSQTVRYITWGIGHLVELKEPKAYDPRWTKWTLGSLPILPERYEFQVAKGKYKQFHE